MGFRIYPMPVIEPVSAPVISAPIAPPDLSAIEEKHAVPAVKSPVYLHQFAFFDYNLSRVKLGKLFHFRGLGIEFCCGLTRYRDNLVASFGVQDQEAWLAEIAPSTVDSLLADARNIVADDDDGLPHNGPGGAATTPVAPKQIGPGPTFPCIVIPERTPEYHMRPHEKYLPPTQPLDATLHRIVVPGEHGAQHNPGICTVKGKLRVNVRVLHGHRTTNYTARVSKDWRLIEPARVTTNLRNLHQVEDLRIFIWRGQPWAVAAVHDGAQPPTAIRQALLRFDGAKIVEAHVQPSMRHEKNWMPAVSGDTLRLVYSIDPLVVTTIDAAGRAVPGGRHVKQTVGYVRGGSQLVYYRHGWLAIVHQVYRPPPPPGVSSNPLMNLLGL